MSSKQGGLVARTGHLRILLKLPQNFVDTSGQVKDAPGDSYYIRAMFDRAAAECQALGQGQQLAFSSGDILWVDNTIYSGVPGNWSAWLLDKDGNKVKWGLIPSKYKVSTRSRSLLSYNAMCTKLN